MVNAGVGQEFLATDYRNSDRIIWDNEIIVKRLWKRVLQGKGIKEYISKLEGEKYRHVFGDNLFQLGLKWQVTEQGINERMRFLKYGAGQFFRGTHYLPGLIFQRTDSIQNIAMEHIALLMVVKDHSILCIFISTTQPMLSELQNQPSKSLMRSLVYLISIPEMSFFGEVQQRFIWEIEDMMLIQRLDES